MCYKYPLLTWWMTIFKYTAIILSPIVVFDSSPTHFIRLTLHHIKIFSETYPNGRESFEVTVIEMHALAIFIIGFYMIYRRYKKHKFLEEYEKNLNELVDETIRLKTQFYDGRTRTRLMVLETCEDAKNKHHDLD